MKHAAVILAGCGSKDGSEIHEATLALYALAVNGCQYTIFAPDALQREVINHKTGQECNQERNIIVEAARIARGDIKPLEELNCKEYDFLVIPGGFGVAKNIFTYAYDGLNFSVLPTFERVVKAFHAKGKPIGAMCITPVAIAKILGAYGVNITLGPTTDLCQEIQKYFGAMVHSVDKRDVVIDKKNRVVTTPSYMYSDASIADIGIGADNMIKAITQLLND